MIKLPSKEEFRNVYLEYADDYLKQIEEKYGRIEQQIAIKKAHGLSMMDALEKATVESRMFNESYSLSAALEGCGHDIGRFPQFLLSGTIKDKESEEFTKERDHGAYGRKILLENNQELLRRFIPEASEYDRFFTEIIGEHTNTQNPNYQRPISELKGLFADSSFEEIVKSKDQTIKDQLIALKLKLLQETDSMELLMNVMTETWVPSLGHEQQYFINPRIFIAFANFDYIDMAKLKAAGLWTANAGFLLRYGLLTRNINFVGNLLQFINQQGFEKVLSTTKKGTTNENNERAKLLDPLVIAGQEYIQLAVNNLIKCSPDGIIITEESREEAKRLTLKEYGSGF